jgi:NAD(P)-dependent dehydrogenase (short-subunit alcohol dehydrogenase family)
MKKQNLNGKVAIVTGGARGIGLATATALAQAGAAVAIGDVDEAALAAAAETSGAKFHGRLDVTDPEGYRAFVDEVEAALGPIDVLVNNAGIMPTGHVHEESEGVARRMFEINVFGVITGTKRALETMLPRRSGHIINVASLAGVSAGAGVATYCGSKHAVVGFTDSARFEYAGSGVEFTTVLPAFVNTDLTAGTHGLKLIKNVEPEDVAGRVINALERPRARVYAPKLGGVITNVQKFLPRSAIDRLTSALGADSVFLEDVDHEKRNAYEERARRS